METDFGRLTGRAEAYHKFPASGWPLISPAMSSDTREEPIGPVPRQAQSESAKPGSSPPAASAHSELQHEASGSNALK